MERDIHKNAIDAKSGILIRKGTRVITEDELKSKAGSRQFIDVMSLDLSD